MIKHLSIKWHDNNVNELLSSHVRVSPPCFYSPWPLTKPKAPPPCAYSRGIIATKPFVWTRTINKP